MWGCVSTALTPVRHSRCSHSSLHGGRTPTFTRPTRCTLERGVCRGGDGRTTPQRRHLTALLALKAKSSRCV